ncbi:RHTO0S11e01156g1_1 [Rhodotorula toruloides]|uniref:RHTO0S11e01156g1_1 n=2 Tax=Rhodotorula toruloides TaxID=5286 RepID=A0A061BC89_RHOTO|nr:zinc-binding alcohol dehydrogenase family protein [Rhodotorula toruloides NP11]EMS20010.1 zinc-binding alcohol dehydrogenase family protein [Rhodotorula toruloides NP11]CDR45509.1 RHTO0S11e01156g1_1 [Rhodotorula toruloides]
MDSRACIEIPCYPPSKDGLPLASLSLSPSLHSPTISAFNFSSFTRLFYSMTTRDIPQQFRAAQFTQSGGELELRETRMQDPRPEEVVIRVHASALNSTDQILRNDLLPGLEFPLTPGQAVVGEVVRQAQRGEGRVKEGSHVAGAFAPSLSAPSSC